MIGICEESDDDCDDDLCDLEGAAHPPKCRRLAKERALNDHLHSGFTDSLAGVRDRPSYLYYPSENNKLAFLQFVWPTSRLSNHLEVGEIITGFVLLPNTHLSLMNERVGQTCRLQWCI